MGEYGQSYEGRKLIALKFNYTTKAKQAVFINAGWHSREWIGPAALLHLISRISDPKSLWKYLLKNIDIYILPMANPDGYYYSRSSLLTKQPFHKANFQRSIKYHG